MQILRSHVPFNVRVRIEAGHIDSVNEIRVCTVIFLGFPSLTRIRTSTSLEAVQTVTQIAQGRMHQDGGFFLQERCDEKGFVMLCAFGLPGRSHEDSPARGIQAALSIVQTLHRHGHAAVAGVTTGNLFCGVVGSSKRAEYTVFGDSINLAARLMVRASHDSTLGPVVCDEPSRWMSAGRTAFIALDSMIVKGRKVPIQAFKVMPLVDDGGGAVISINSASVGGIGHHSMMEMDKGRDTSPVLLPRLVAAQQQQQQHEYHQYTTNDMIATAAADSQSFHLNYQKSRGGGGGDCSEKVNSPSSSSSSHGGSGGAEALTHLTPLIGRDKEISLLGARLTALVDGRGGGAVFIEGEAGLGKSRLAEEIAWGQGLAPLRQRCIVLAGAGRAMRQAEPLYPWRRIFLQAFRVDAQRCAERRGNSSSCRESDDGSVFATDLACRLAERVPEYAVWRPVLASALGLRESELPPAIVSSSSSFEKRGVVDEVTLLLLPRAHTFANDSKTTNYTLSSPLDNDDDNTDNNDVDEFLVQQNVHSPPARSASATNLDPGRPFSAGSSSGSGGTTTKSTTTTTTAITTRNNRAVGPPPAEMSVPLRAQKVRGLLVALLREFAACHAPMLIVMDDMHFFDSPSWRLVLAVLAALPKEVLLLGTLRPVLPLPSSSSGPSSSPSSSIATPIAVTNPHQNGATPPPPPPLPAAALTPVGPSAATLRSGGGGVGALSHGSFGPDELFYRKLGEYYEEALWRERSDRLSLHHFTLTESQEFMSTALGGVAVPLAVAELFWAKSAGMPAFLHQLSLFLKLRAQEVATATTKGGGNSTAERSEKNQFVSGGSSTTTSTTTTTASKDDATAMQIAYLGMQFVRSTVNVHSIVPARVDRLRPDEQLTLKVASVMGITVYTDLLRAIHPKSPSKRRLETELRALRSAGFLVKENGSGGGGGGDVSTTDEDVVWVFVDVLARDVVYNMIPMTQRKQWHAQLAAEMAIFGGDGDGGDAGGNRAIPASIIAYHWSFSCFEDEATEVSFQSQRIDFYNKRCLIINFLYLLWIDYVCSGKRRWKLFHGGKLLHLTLDLPGLSMRKSHVYAMQRPSQQRWQQHHRPQTLIIITLLLHPFTFQIGDVRNGRDAQLLPR